MKDSTMALILFMIALAVTIPIAAILLALLMVVVIVYNSYTENTSVKDDFTSPYYYKEPKPFFVHPEPVVKDTPVKPKELGTLGDNLWLTTKARFLRSPEWDLLRRATLARDSYGCTLCGVTGIPLDVHHTSYPIEHATVTTKDLITLCRDCHDKAHKALGYDYNRTYTLNEIKEAL